MVAHDFCTGCGRRLESDLKFCPQCGRARERSGAADGESPAQSPATPAPADAPAGVATGVAVPAGNVVAPTQPQQPTPMHQVQRVRTVATNVQRATMLGTAVAGAPWQTIVAGQPGVLADYARRWAPSLVAVLPRPNLRVPARALLFTVMLELIVAFVSGQPPAMAALGWRVLFGLGTAFWGLVAGRKKGFAQKMTVGMSAITSVIQVVALFRGLAGLFGGGVAVLPMLASLVVQVASLLATAKSFWLARKR